MKKIGIVFIILIVVVIGIGFFTRSQKPSIDMQVQGLFRSLESRTPADIFSTDTEQEHISMAVGLLWGVEYRHTRGYQQYCNNAGVDMAVFTERFLDINSETIGDIGRNARLYKLQAEKGAAEEYWAGQITLSIEQELASYAPDVASACESLIAAIDKHPEYFNMAKMFPTEAALLKQK